MELQYYTLDKIPDFTMAKYSAQESGDVEDILKQHSIFYRQLHRRGLMSGETYTLLYQYDPGRPPGKKLQIFFRVESQKEISFMDPFLRATSLAESFPLQRCSPGENREQYTSLAVLCKGSGIIRSSLPGNESDFYVVDKWKTSQKGRLMGMFRLMKAMDRRCTYSVRLFPRELTTEYGEAFQRQIKWMKPPASGTAFAALRDENAEKCVKLYQDTADSLRENPHFYCEISAYADDRETARLLVDAAAAEAVEEGNYRIFTACTDGKSFYQPMLPHGMYLPKSGKAFEGAEYWHALFLLKEIVPFACFPTLYPGESIEIPKETAPVYEKNGLNLGKDPQGYDVYLPLQLLSKHAFLAGVPGSGKTYTMLHLASQLANGKNRRPILVFEPAKQEYRALAQNPEVYDLTVFSPGGSGSFPLRINPFEFPRGMKLAEHIVNLREVFIGAFDLMDPMPFLLDQGIENVYRSCGWYPFDYNDFDESGRNKKPYPTMQMLYDEVEKLLEASGYAPEVRSNLQTVLQLRIGSLVRRETGGVFNVPRSTFRPEEWMQHSCVLELESLGKDGANFLTLFLATIVRELLKQNPHSDISPRHVMFFEEAHNLIGRDTEASRDSGNVKVASTKFIVDMLAEVRALEESIIIADQLPTSLAPQVTKNTSLKIALRITAQDDREMMASTMSADGVQLEQMALLQPGFAFCLYENVQKPFQLHITPYAGNATPPDNEQLYAIQSKKETYRECMRRDMEIVRQKMEDRKERLLDEWKSFAAEGPELEVEKRKAWDVSNVQERQRLVKKITQLQEAIHRGKENLLQNHLELILEFGEYVRMNQLMRRTGYEYLKKDQEEFAECVRICNNEKSYSLDRMYEQANREFKVMWENMKVRR